MQINLNSTKTFMSNQAKNEVVEKDPKAKKPSGGEKIEQTSMASALDSFVKAPETSSVTYTREMMTVEASNEIAEESVMATDTASAATTYVPSEGMSAEAIDFAQLAEQRSQSFQNMIRQMAGEQVDAFKASTYENLENFEITEEAILEAQESISEGGEWSPEAVAGRIIDMAKALSGGDVEKLELLKDAVIKGFGAAEDAWGGEMPEITSTTYDLVMQGFDDWAAQSTQASAVLTA